MAPPPAISANPAMQDIARWLTSRLSEPWSAPAVSPLLTKEILERALVYFRHVDPLVRVGLILACLTLRRGVAMEMKAELEQLAQKALEDDDEWVRAVGASVGRFSGTLDFASVEQQFDFVGTSLEKLRASLDKVAISDALASALAPKENVFLSPHVLPSPACPRASAPSHAHFCVRQKSGYKPGDGTGSEQEPGHGLPRGASTQMRGNHIVGSFSTSHLQQSPRLGTGPAAFGSSNRAGASLGRSSSCSMLKGGAGGKKPRLKQLDVSDVIALQRMQGAASAWDAKRADAPPALAGESPLHPLKKRGSQQGGMLAGAPGKKRATDGAVPEEVSAGGPAGITSASVAAVNAHRPLGLLMPSSDPNSPSIPGTDDAGCPLGAARVPPGGAPMVTSQEEGELEEGEEPPLVYTSQDSPAILAAADELRPLRAQGHLGAVIEEKRVEMARGPGVVPFSEGAEEERRRQEGLTHVTEALSEALSKAGGGSSLL